jgi:hypothetical protein
MPLEGPGWAIMGFGLPTSAALNSTANTWVVCYDPTGVEIFVQEMPYSTTAWPTLNALGCVKLPAGMSNLTAQYRRADTGSTRAAGLTYFAGVVVPDAEGVMVRRTTSQAVAANTPVNVSFDVETEDDAGFYFSGTPDQCVVPSGKAGWYVISGWTRWATQTSSNRRCHITVNGTTVSGLSASGLASVKALTVPAVVYLNVGDVVRLMGYSGAAATITSACLRMVRVPTSYAARVESSSNQNVAQTSGLVTLTYNTEVRDDGGLVNLGVNNTKFVIPVGGAGWYVVVAGCYMTGGGQSASRAWYVRRNNGADEGSIHAQLCASSHPDPVGYAADIDYYEEGDEIQQMVANYSNGTTATAQGGTIYLAAIRIRT